MNICTTIFCLLSNTYKYYVYCNNNFNIHFIELIIVQNVDHENCSDTVVEYGAYYTSSTGTWRLHYKIYNYIVQ
jgi:hypothetical protein